MKKLYIILVALFLINGAMAQWFPQNSGTGEELHSVHFIDSNTGYVVGDSGIILKTFDGGINWTRLTSNTLFRLFFADFMSEDTGYVVGGIGRNSPQCLILKTTDGGANWLVQFQASGFYLFSVYFTNIDTGYAVGGYGTILKTTDGGTIWTYQNSGSTSTLNSVYFIDANIGYVIGNNGTLLKTTDGGATWIAQILNTCSWFDLTSVFFTDSITGFITGVHSSVGYHWSVLLKTVDGGATWTVQNNGIHWLISIFFPEGEIGYSVGWGTILKTIDGGESWWVEQGSFNWILNSVYFTEQDTGYAVGREGIIIKTTNGGGYPLGTDDLSSITNSLRIYPNPASTYITVSTPTKGSVSILNIDGQQLLQQAVTEPTTTINVAGLKSGVYFVRLANDKMVQVGKFIKQ